MYLSRIQLTPAIAGQSQLGYLLRENSYGMHRLLWDLFDGSDGKGQRFLFREESAREQLGSSRNLPLYYVLSTVAPNPDNPLFRVETKPFLPRLKKGDNLAFRLRANPTVAKKQQGKKNSVRHDVVMNAQQQWLKSACIERGLTADGRKSELRHRLLTHNDFNGGEGKRALQEALDDEVQKASIRWLDARADKNGFSVIESSLQVAGYQWHTLPEKGRGAGFSSINYEGSLVIKEPGRLLSVIAQGVGPSKAFGCGLMLIKRV